MVTKSAIFGYFGGALVALYLHTPLVPLWKENAITCFLYTISFKNLLLEKDVSSFAFALFLIVTGSPQTMVTEKFNVYFWNN